MNSSTWAMIGLMLMLAAMMGQVSSRPDVIMRAGGPATGGGVPPEQSPPSIYSVPQDTGMGEEILGQEEGKAMDGLKTDMEKLAEESKLPDRLHQHEGDYPPNMAEGAPGVIDQDPRIEGETLLEEDPNVYEPGDAEANPDPNRPPVDPPYVPDNKEEVFQPQVEATSQKPTNATAAPEGKKILGMSVPVFCVVIILIVILVILIAFGIWYMIRQKKKKAMKEAGANAEVASVTPITTADGTKAQIVKIEPISEGGSSGSANP